MSTVLLVGSGLRSGICYLRRFCGYGEETRLSVVCHPVSWGRASGTRDIRAQQPEQSPGVERVSADRDGDGDGGKGLSLSYPPVVQKKLTRSCAPVSPPAPPVFSADYYSGSGGGAR